VSGSIMRSLVITLGTLAAATAAATQESAPAPAAAFRADHMILDAAVRGSTVLVGTQSGRVSSFDWRAGQERDALLSLRAAGDQALAPTIRSVAISPSERFCAVGSSDGVLRLFDLDAVAPRDPVLRVEQPDLLVARFANDERVLLGNMRGELALLDLSTGEEIYRRQLEYDPIYAIALEPDGRRAAVAFRSSRIQIVSVADGRTLQDLAGHRDSVFDIEWLGEHALATVGKDKRLLVWDLRARELTPHVLYTADHYITALGFDPGTRRLSLPLADHRIGIMRLADGQITRRLAGHTAPIQVLHFFDGGRRLLSAGHDARVFVWNLNPESEEDRQ